MRTGVKLQAQVPLSTASDRFIYLSTVDQTMDLTIDMLQAEVLQLAAPDKARLLDIPLDSIDQDEDVERDWEKIADHRDAELDSGTVRPVDGRAILARLRAKFSG